MSLSAGSGQILHIDMNAFYCSCHAAAEPLTFARKPTAVAGNPETRHGIVVTASYEARRRGVRATMTVQQAVRACPNLILIPPDFELYREFSRRVFALIQEYTPQVEVFSIDECWADVSGCSQFGTPLDIARKIQTRIQAELRLPCSIGIGPNKFVAKMASDLKKPMGITEISPDDVATKLWPLPVEQMFGVGKSSAERLQRLAIRTIGDLAATDLKKLAPLFGKRSFAIHEHANGRDQSRVSSEQEPAKSVGHSITLSADTADFEELSTVLLNLSDQVGRRVRRHKRVGKTVQLTLRFANRNTITRSKTLPRATDLTEDIYKTAQALLLAHRRSDQKVRLIGVSLT
ncbi:MAG: DNA polymerase IV, partial [Alicyclobacillus sp. RIFOXYA1_FULL_53_8]